MGSKLILIFQTFEVGENEASVLSDSASVEQLEFILDSAIKFADEEVIDDVAECVNGDITGDVTVDATGDVTGDITTFEDDLREDVANRDSFDSIA